MHPEDVFNQPCHFKNSPKKSRNNTFLFYQRRQVWHFFNTYVIINICYYILTQR